MSGGGTDNDSDNDAQRGHGQVKVESQKRKYILGRGNGEEEEECQVLKKLKEERDDKSDKFFGVIGKGANGDYFLCNLLGGAPVVDGHLESGGGGGHGERRKHR